MSETTTLRVRKRSVFRIRWEVIALLIITSAVAFILGMALQFQLDHPPIPACTDKIATEGGICQGPLQ